MRIRKSFFAFIIMVACSFGVLRGQAINDGQPASSPWWEHAFIYELYPRSFQDSNGDGAGDLNGITRRLDYLEELKIDAIG